MTIKRLYINYNDGHGTFSAGDSISGRVIVEVSKETKIQSFFVKVKGKAEVKWSEHKEGVSPVAFSDKKIYFCFEHSFLQEGKGDGSEMIGPGRQVFPFSFKIPNKDMPSSYEGEWGKITYSLRAKLTKTAWQIYKAKTGFTFVSKSDMNIPWTIQAVYPQRILMEPQYGTKVLFYANGSITMNVESERMGYEQGETIQVHADIHNRSACAVTPTFYLCEKQTFFVQPRRNVHTNDIITERGEPVPASTQQTMTKVLTIPTQLPVSMFNCTLLKLEYRLKVTLDVPRARDSEIKLPLIVLLNQSKAP